MFFQKYMKSHFHISYQNFENFGKNIVLNFENYGENGKKNFEENNYLIYTKDYFKDGTLKYLPAHLAYFL